ncbi:FBP domain-containing protein [Luedemannella helvata]|uniref:FBP domain-containing protein n=1 Tax=Luedemannella helvata TaxID=349315 RepID=A0ABP4VYZ0_9ACTN
MEPVTEEQIRAAMVNCSRGEAADMTLPDLKKINWAETDYFGWRDPRSRLRGFLVHWRDDRLVGVVLRAPDSGVRRPAAMCLLCESVRQSNEIALFTARKAGASGRKGDSVGTYICADLDCSRQVRATPPGRAAPDEAVVILRSAALLTKVYAFTAAVLDGA